MAARKIVRDFVLSRYGVARLCFPQGVVAGRARLMPADRLASARGFSVFNDIKDKLKGEIDSHPELKKSMEELKEKKDSFAARTKQRSERLLKEVDGLWTETEVTAKKVTANVKEKISSATEEVTANMKEKISSATEEVKEKMGLGKQGPSEGTTSTGSCSQTTNGSQEENGSNSHTSSEQQGTSETYYQKFKKNSSAALNKLKEFKIVDLAKKGYDIVKDELSINPHRRRQIRQAAASAAEPKELSTRTDIVVVPRKQSAWSKKWEAFRDKMRGHPVIKKISGYSEPVVTKSQEIAEDMRERWETSDHPVVHKIQDLNDTVFGETATALSFKEIRRIDPSFSLTEFVAEVQEMIRPTLTAYIKCDVEKLKKYCSDGLIEKCKAERNALTSAGIYFDNKLLHISDVDVKETKLMGESPIIIVSFHTQQIYCARDLEGLVMEGGKDTIHNVQYAWAMQLVDAQELGEGAIHPMWKLREMQHLGIQGLI